MTFPWTRPARYLLAASLMGLTAFPALGQPTPVPGAPGLAPGTADALPQAATPGLSTAPAADTTRNTVIPEVDFKEMPLDDVVSYLQDVSKDYRAVVVRRTPKEAGPLITMRVKGASIQQLLTIIMTAYPGITVVPVEGPNGPVDVITIHSPGALVNLPGGGMGGFDPMMAEMGMAAGEPQQVVRVYRLTGIVATMIDRKEIESGDERVKAEKTALADILSLVKATMETAGGREAPKLQLHEETSTLIFSGSLAQQQALEDVLLALETDEAVRSGTAKQRATEIDVRRLESQLKDARAALEQARQEAVLTRTELNGVQRQTDAQLQELLAKNREYRDQIESLQADMRRLLTQKKELPEGTK